jgi:hypothetical protein
MKEFGGGKLAHIREMDAWDGVQKGIVLLGLLLYTHTMQCK